MMRRSILPRLLHRLLPSLVAASSLVLIHADLAHAAGPLNEKGKWTAMNPQSGTASVATT